FKTAGLVHSAPCRCGQDRRFSFCVSLLPAAGRSLFSLPQRPLKNFCCQDVKSAGKKSRPAFATLARRCRYPVLFIPITFSLCLFMAELWRMMRFFQER
ncbi:hypothetical protein, partial [Franconibacter helveticus]|uniref:hypothetical protein n=1 Tax=Franconibacter helveticus TaxID=357240 RepID=UPI001F16B520